MKIANLTIIVNMLALIAKCAHPSYQISSSEVDKEIIWNIEWLTKLQKYEHS